MTGAQYMVDGGVHNAMTGQGPSPTQVSEAVVQLFQATVVL